MNYITVSIHSSRLVNPDGGFTGRGRPARSAASGHEIRSRRIGRALAKPINADAKIMKGERIAVIGENGAGKTTITKLIARLYDPTEGEILLDGSDLREYDLEDWRREVGVKLIDGSGNLASDLHGNHGLKRSCGRYHLGDVALLNWHRYIRRFLGSVLEAPKT